MADDFAQTSARLSMQNATAPKGADQPAENIFDVIFQGLEKMIGTIGKSVAGVNVTGLGKTSILANIDIQQAAVIKADNQVNQGRILGVGSDTNPTIASALIKNLQLASIKDIKSETLSYGNAPAIDVSWAQLGQLPIQNLGFGGGQGAGLSMS